MRHRRVVWCVLFLPVVACGRLGFDEEADADIDASVGNTTASHTFADDFDRVTDVARGWSAADQSGGTLALDAGSLLVTVDGPSGLPVNLLESLPRVTTGVRVAFDLELADVPANAEVDLVQLRWLEPAAPCTKLGYYFVRDRTNVLVMQETYEDCAANYNDDLPVSNARHHFELVVELTGRLRVAVDGTSMLDKQVAPIIHASPLELRLGVPAVADATGAVQLRYDDLVVDAW